MPMGYFMLGFVAGVLAAFLIRSFRVTHTRKVVTRKVTEVSALCPTHGRVSLSDYYGPDALKDIEKAEVVFCPKCLHEMPGSRDEAQ